MELQGCQQQQLPHMDLQGCIYKPFGNSKWRYKGKIFQHDAREKLYKILYKDGDAEELSHEEVLTYTTTPIDTSATRFERVEQEYWTAQQLGRCRSPRIEKL